MKGTMSELELSLFRQRSQEALRQMARRGALVLGVAAGYVKVGRDRIEKNPDKRVQRAEIDRQVRFVDVAGHSGSDDIAPSSAFDAPRRNGRGPRSPAAASVPRAPTAPCRRMRERCSMPSGIKSFWVVAGVALHSSPAPA
jgi:hypothetical protein